MPHDLDSGACGACLFHSELLRLLSVRIEYAARDLGQLVELLALDDQQLIDALGGGRRQELHRMRRELDGGGAKHADDATSRVKSAHLDGGRAESVDDARALCVHSRRWRELFGSLGAAHGGEAPRMLWLAGERQRLARMLAEPVVAIVGSRRSSEYGAHVASQLGRRLADAGITVAAPFAEGISAAALSGALQPRGAMHVRDAPPQRGAPLAIAASGIDLCQPAHLRGLRGKLCQEGCLITEMPLRFRGRRWSLRASRRTTLSLSQLVIFVEAEPDSPELELAALAQAQGKAIAAVPGQLGCPGAEGPHRLIREGAPLIRCAEDALDLVYGVAGVPARDALATDDPLAELDPHLRTVLHRIGCGENTLGKLGSGPCTADTLLAVSELEALGLLCRGRSGRYLPQLSARGDGARC